MTEVKTDTVEKVIQANAVPLNQVPGDLDALIQRISDAELVLIGEASHGTHDFYRVRAEITKWNSLIARSDPSTQRWVVYVNHRSADRRFDRARHSYAEGNLSTVIGGPIQMGW